MHRRVHFDCPEQHPPIAKLCAMRDYLRLSHHRQRAAITMLLFSEHPLSAEQLRSGPVRIERHLRVCRWCTHSWAIEDETHVLLECDGEPLRTLRAAFFDEAVPSLRRAHFRLSSPALLDMLLRGTTTLPLLADYVASVFEQCDNTPPITPGRRVPRGRGWDGLTSSGASSECHWDGCRRRDTLAQGACGPFISTCRCAGALRTRLRAVALLGRCRPRALVTYSRRLNSR